MSSYNYQHGAYNSPPPIYSAGSYANPPQQQYGQQQSGPQNQYHEPPPPTKDHSDVLDLSKDKPRDLWAAILYFLTLVGYGFFSYHFIPIALVQMKQEAGKATPGDASSSPGIGRNYSGLAALGIGLGVAIAASILMTSLLLALINRFPKQMIRGSFYASAGVNFALGVVLILSGAWIPAIFCFLGGAMLLLCLYFWRNRVAFSAVLLSTVISILKRYPACYGLQALALVWDFGIALLVSLNQYGLQTLLSKSSSSGSPSSNSSYESQYMAAVAFNMLVFFWSIQISHNVVHTTVAGVVGSFYFLAHTVTGSHLVNKVSNPTAKSLRRALTTSFGSVAFGSLLVALIQLARYFINAAKQNARQERRQGQALLLAILDCLLSIVEGLAAYFNYYAYIHVALYGKPYLQAAQDTVSLIKRSGIGAVINDSLVGQVFGITSFMIAVASGGTTYLLTSLLFAATSTLNSYALIASLLAFVSGFLVSSMAFQSITSAVSTTYVCAADDLGKLRINHPELYAKFQHSLHGQTV